MKTNTTMTGQTNKTSFFSRLHKKSFFMGIFAILVIVLLSAGSVLAFLALRSDSATFKSSINSNVPVRQHLLKVDGSGELIATLTDTTEIESDKVRYSLTLLNDTGQTVQRVDGNTPGKRVKMANDVTAGVYTMTVSTIDELSESGARYTLEIQYPNETSEFDDVVAPQISISSPELGAEVSGIFTISGEASDDVEIDQVSVRIDEGAWVVADGTTSWSVSIDSEKFENGNRVVDIQVLDTSGNITTESTLYDFINEAPDPQPDPNPSPDPDSTPGTPDADSSPQPTPLPREDSPMSNGAFSVDFANNTGLESFRTGVYHRNYGSQERGQEPQIWGDGNAGHGGSWTGDHDLGCGSPDTQRQLGTSKSDFKLEELVYVCRDHLMTSMGQADGYSILWFSPDQAFNRDVHKTISWDVNVTDLGGRQWWEVSIIPVGSPFLATVDWLAGTANIDSYDNRAVIVGSGPFGSTPNITANGENQYDGWQKICHKHYPLDAEGCSSKPIRRPFSVTDNNDGTLTVDYGGMFTQTINGSLPDEFQVYFKDHNYTPDKDGIPVGHTWHWDNISVR